GLVLVRNPSWSRASDPLREADADRIEFSVFDTKPHTIAEVASGSPAEQAMRFEQEYAAKIDSGQVDFLLDYPSPAEQVRRYQNDPALSTRVQIHPFGDVRFLSFNLADPPFDDVHVRKAINFVIDKQKV